MYDLGNYTMYCYLYSFIVCIHVVATNHKRDLSNLSNPKCKALAYSSISPLHPPVKV